MAPALTIPATEAAHRAAQHLHARGPTATAFIADWRDMLFIHFGVPPQELQAMIPLPVDHHAGLAWISLALFTQAGLRPRFGGACGALALRPIATHSFCNLRTYVRVNGEAAILFLREWIPNRIALALGPRTYGLPYHYGRVTLHHADPTWLTGDVQAKDSTTLRYHGEARGHPRPANDAQARFLVERYTAFTVQRGHRLFRIAHRPWPQSPATVRLEERTLIDTACPLLRGRQPDLAHYSPGVCGVRIGRPLGAERAGERRDP